MRPRIIEEKIVGIAAQMRRAVMEGASERGALRLHVPYADHYWTLTVHADGTTRYENYAAESRGERGDINDLALWELGHLLQQLLSR